MIVPMKKYTFLVFHGVYEDFLAKLRGAGVLHVRSREADLSAHPELQQRLDEGRRLKAMLGQLEARLDQESVLQPADPKTDGLALLSRLETQQQEQAERQLGAQNLQKELEAARIWGHFDWQKLRALEAAGCRMEFFSCSRNAYRPEWETLYHAVPVNEVGSTLYFVTLSLDGPLPDLAADRVRMPARSLAQLESDWQTLQQEIQAADEAFRQAALTYTNTLKLAEVRVRESYDLAKVHCDTEKTAGDRVMLLEGYVPEDGESDLLAMLDTAGVWYQAESARDDDAQVPIKLKNGKFARLFEPLTKLYSLPNYGELDPTAAFAPFFTLFFGLCLGDGGYGLLVFAAATVAKRLLPKLRGYAIMGQCLGISTMVVGLLTGMVFGISLDSVAWPWLADVKHLFVTGNNFKPLGYDPMMVFAICIGMFQILFAMGFKVVKIWTKVGLKYALSDLGWLVLLVDLIVYLVLCLAKVSLAPAATYVVWGLAGLCAVAIFFFNSPGKNPFLQFGSGLWGTYNMVSGLLGDVLSYIRLFALGLAGGILGSVFNSLAFQAGGALPVWIGWLPTAFILLFGHGLNFFLCIISSIVHPLRLTYVEFFKNSGYEGGGREYTPFRSQI